MAEPLYIYTIAGVSSLFFARTGISKLMHLAEFRTALVNYRILPKLLADFFAIVLPLIEVAVAIALLLPAYQYYAAGVAISLMFLFAAAIVINLLRGRSEISCGCNFGGAHEQDKISWGLVVKNLMYALIVALIFVPVTARSLSGFDIFQIVCAVIFIDGLRLFWQYLNYLKVLTGDAENRVG